MTNMKRLDFIRNLGFLPLVAIIPVENDAPVQRVSPMDFLLNEGWVLKSKSVEEDKEYFMLSHPKTIKCIKMVDGVRNTNKERETWIFADPNEFSHFSAFRTED